MSKYEQLIEYIINEQEDKARELFHQIVVEKSREIYESLIDEQDLEEVGGNEVESMVDEITGDEEGLDEGDEEALDVEMDADEDGTDDSLDLDMDMDDAGDHHADMGGEEELEDRVMDLEDALDELKAEFDALMGQEGGEEEHMGGEEEFGADEGGEEDMAEMGVMEAEEDDDDEEDDEEEVDESVQESRKGRKMTEAEWLREYVDKIGDVYSQEPAQAEGNEVGAGKKASVSAKSIVAGKNDMGGTAKNLNQGDKGEDPDGKQVPQPNNQYSKGKGNLPGAGQFKNVPGGDAGKSSFKTKEGEYSKEHGKEGETTGGKVPVEKKSILKRIGK